MGDVPYIDNPHAPDVFADAASGIFVWDGTARLTLEVLRPDHEGDGGPPRRVVVGRLIMPLARAEEMARLILMHAERMRATEESQTAVKN